MLNLEPFGFELIRKYTAIFGTLFNEIKLERFDTSGNRAELIKIPLSMTPMDKVMSRLRGDPTLDKKAAVVLPRMSFQLVSVEYDPTRQLNAVGKDVIASSNGVSSYQYNPVAYNFNYKLWIYVKNVEDGTRIVEQILPFFRPEFTVRAELIPEMGRSMNIPIVLKPVTLDDKQSEDFTERRAIVWALDFILKGWLWGPVQEYPVIKFVDTKLYNATRHDDIYDAVGNTAAIDRVTMQPGQLANGAATTNAAASVPYSEIEEEENWGYAAVIVGNMNPSEGTGGDQSNNLPYVP